MAQLNPTYLVYTERDLLKDIKRLETKQQDRDAKTREQVDLLKKLHHIGKSVCQIRISKSAQAPSFCEFDRYSETGCLGNEDDYILQETDQGFSETEFVGNGFYYGEGWIATNTYVAQGGLDKAKIVFSWYENQPGETEPVKSEVSFECSPAFSVLRENSEGVISQDLAFCELTEQKKEKENLQPVKIELAQDPFPETTVYHIYWRFEGGKADKLFTITKLTDKCEDIIQFESQAFQIKGSSGSPVLVQQPSMVAKHCPKELSLLGVFLRAESNSRLGRAISYYNTMDYAEQITLIMSNIQDLKKLHSDYCDESRLLIEEEAPEAGWDMSERAQLLNIQKRTQALKILDDKIDSLTGNKLYGQNTVVFSMHTLRDIKFPWCRPHFIIRNTAAALRDYVTRRQTKAPSGYRLYTDFDKVLPKGYTYYEAQVGTGRAQLENTESVALLYNSTRHIFRKFNNGFYNFRERDVSQWSETDWNNIAIWRRVRNTLVELQHYVRISALNPHRHYLPPVGYENLGRNPGHGLQIGEILEEYHKADVNRGCWRVVIGFDKQKKPVYQFCTYDHYKTFFLFGYHP